MTIMPRHLIQTLEYECSRCGWMWIGRRNGREKYTKGHNKDSVQSVRHIYGMLKGL